MCHRGRALLRSPGSHKLQTRERTCHPISQRGQTPRLISVSPPGKNVCRLAPGHPSGATSKKTHTHVWTLVSLPLHVQVCTHTCSRARTCVHMHIETRTSVAIPWDTLYLCLEFLGLELTRQANPASQRVLKIGLSPLHQDGKCVSLYNFVPGV